MTEPLELDGSHVCWIDPAYDAPDPADADPNVRASAVFTSEREKLAAQGLKILRREQWGASRSYTDARAVTMPAKRFFLHVAVVGSSGSFASRMRLIESIGISRFPNTGISYNAAVDFGGALAEAQPLSRRGAHTIVEYAPNKMGLPNGHNANYDSRALVLPQNCPDRVTDQQIDSAAKWAAAQIRAGLAVKGAKWYGHRDAARKSCPCDVGYRRIPELQQLTDRYVKTGLGGTMSATGPEKWDAKDWAAFDSHVAAKLAAVDDAVWSYPIPNNVGSGTTRPARDTLRFAHLDAYRPALGWQPTIDAINNDLALIKEKLGIGTVEPPLPPASSSSGQVSEETG